MSKSRKFPLLPALLATTLLLVVSVGGWLFSQYRQFSDAPLALPQGEQVLEVARGDGFQTIVGKLRVLGIDEGHEWEWRLLARELDVARKLQAGDYRVEPGLSPRALLGRLASGKVIHYGITLVEGWNFRELRAALASENGLVQTLPGMSDDQVMAALERPGLHPEGRFLPETYHYTRGMSDLDVLRRALSAMEQSVAEVWAERDSDLPLQSPEELLVLASIIEKETGAAHERPTIAGVFVRRLKLGMRLQTDPTVIYGIGSAYDGNIRKRDLETDTPYNTYTRAGLPPTPIAMPGRAALQAAAHPEKGSALFFVSRNDGTHVFSSTLAEHNRAVDCYQRKRCP
ncbi:MAG TPA: endolytic transglycosylase MltG [Arenimonas sp.]|nr:endolytic transglycosylase MltG [Arenimonas sp.]